MHFFFVCIWFPDASFLLSLSITSEIFFCPFHFTLTLIFPSGLTLPSQEHNAVRLTNITDKLLKLIFVALKKTLVAGLQLGTTPTAQPSFITDYLPHSDNHWAHTCHWIHINFDLHSVTPRTNCSLTTSSLYGFLSDISMRYTEWTRDSHNDILLLL